MDFLTQMQTTAVGHHEVYTAYVEAGFTEEQAMQMLNTLMVISAQRTDNG